MDSWLAFLYHAIQNLSKMQTPIHILGEEVLAIYLHLPMRIFGQFTMLMLMKMLSKFSCRKRHHQPQRPVPSPLLIHF